MAEDDQKTERVYIRVSPEEKDRIRLHANASNATMSGYLRELVIVTPKLSNAFTPEIINSVNALRSTVGKFTGMLKQAIASDKYNPKEFAAALKDWQGIKTKTDRVLEDCIDRIARIR